MRASVCLCTLLGVVPALLLTAPAHAKIRPLPKPPSAAVGTPSGIAPVVRPTVRPAVRTPHRPVATSPPVRPRTTVRHRAPLRSRRPAHVLARSRGGRTAGPLRISGGRRQPVAIPALRTAPPPTPLGLVGVGETLPAGRSVWPSWMLSLLGALLAGEAFLLVRLVRARRRPAGV